MSPSIMLRALIAAMVALASLVAARAHAFGGLEISPGGARALSRGGATTVRAEDGYVLLHNPAGLAALQQDALVLNIDAPFHDMCVKPYGYYGWGVVQAGESEFGNSGEVELDSNGDPIIGATYATDPLDEVCNSDPVRPLPGIAYTLKLGGDLGLGFGMLAPGGLPGLQYGGEDGTIDGANGARPTPTRYQLIKQEVTFALGPTIGIGYRVLPRVRLGLALTWIAVANELRIAQAAQSGTSPHNDMLVRLKAHDYFVPAATLGVLATPFDWLDAGLVFRVVDDFNGSGEVIYTTNAYRPDAANGFTAYTNDPIGLSKVKVPLPWLLTGGVRFVGLLPNAKRTGDGMPLRGDPLTQELFDVELDAAFQMNARTSSRNVSFEPGELITRMADGTSNTLDVPDPDMNDFSSDLHNVDAFSLRLGGTYNLFPGTMSASGGVFYESRGVDASYADIDTFAFARVGVGLGVAARLSDWDFVVAYGHVFQETLTVAPPKHQVLSKTTEDPTTGFDKRVGAPDDDASGYVLQEQNAPSKSETDATAKKTQASLLDFKGKHPRVVNAGVYTASFNVLSISAAYRF